MMPWIIAYLVVGLLIYIWVHQYMETEEERTDLFLLFMTVVLYPLCIALMINDAYKERKGENHGL